MEKLIAKYKRRLQRLQKAKAILDLKYNGNETKYTFHGGWNLGYVTGEISRIEDFIDDLEDLQKE
jgi:hypothetical protein